MALMKSWMPLMPVSRPSAVEETAAGPGGDRGDHAHGGGGGVNEVGQLGTGDPMAVGDGPHDGAHGEAVEIVIDEDQNAQQEGSKGSPHLGLNAFLMPSGRRQRSRRRRLPAPQ